MSTVFQKVKELGIPLNSMVAASNHMAAQWDVNTTQKSEYDFQIGSLTGRNIVTTDRKRAELTFKYLVQEAIRYNLVNKTDIDTDSLIEIAVPKVQEFLTKNPWVAVAASQETTRIVVQEDGTEVEVAVTSKKRKGVTKRQLSIELYSKHKDKNLPRQELIDIFVKELGLTPAGASTYVHNCKSGAWV